MTISKSVIQRLKTQMNMGNTVVSTANQIAKDLSETIKESMDRISLNSKAVKTVIDVSTDQEVSSGPRKMDLGKIPVHSSNGLFVENGRIKQLPQIDTLVTPTRVFVSGVGNSFITKDESGEELEKPLLYFSEDISNGMEFQFQANGLASILLNFEFSNDTKISIIKLDTGNSYSGRQTNIDSIFLSDSRSIKFKTIRSGRVISLILEEEIDTSFITLRMSSSGFISGENLSILRFSSLKFGRLSYQLDSEIVFGPIGDNLSRIVKFGVSIDRKTQGISFLFSADLNTWYPFDTENEKGFSASINTIFSKSKNINTTRLYVKCSVTNELDVKVLERISFEKYVGEDCYDTNLHFGGASISNLVIPEFLQHIYETATDKYLYVSDIDQLKNYRISMIPFNPVAVNRVFEEKYGTIVVVDPNNSVLYAYSEVVQVGEANINSSHFVYKRKDGYLPGRYSYIVNGESKKSFDVYGDFDVSLSRYVLKCLKTDTVKIVLETILGKKTFDKSDILSLSVSDTEEYLSMANLFTITEVGYTPAFFYPHSYLETESITENGANIQNGKYIAPFTKLNYPKGKIKELSVRDIDLFEGFLKHNVTTLDRVKTYITRHKKIKNVVIPNSPNLTRVQYRNGLDEFIEKKKITTNGTVTNRSIPVTGITLDNDIEIYTSGFARKLIRVFSEKDIVSEFNFYVSETEIRLHVNLEGTYLNILYDSNVSGTVSGNMFSVDYENGVIFFSSYQNQITVEYDYLDCLLFGNFYSEKSIATEGVLESVGIEVIKEDIPVFSITEIPAVNFGVIYE